MSTLFSVQLYKYHIYLIIFGLLSDTIYVLLMI